MATKVAVNWDKMSREARMKLLKATGSFPGNVGKTWAQLSGGAKARLGATPNTTEAKESEKPTKKPATIKNLENQIEHAKAKIHKPVPDPKPELDDKIVAYARKHLAKTDVAMLFGRWPETAKEFPGKYFVAIPSSGEVVVCDAPDQKTAITYIQAILRKN